MYYLRLALCVLLLWLMLACSARPALTAYARPPRTAQVVTKIVGEADHRLPLHINQSPVTVNQDGKYEHEVRLTENGLNIFYVVQGTGADQRGIKLGVYRWPDAAVLQLEKRTRQINGRRPLLLFNQWQDPGCSVTYTVRMDRFKAIVCDTEFGDDFTRKEFLFDNAGNLWRLRITNMSPESHYVFSELMNFNEKTAQDLKAWLDEPTRQKQSWQSGPFRLMLIRKKDLYHYILTAH